MKRRKFIQSFSLLSLLYSKSYSWNNKYNYYYNTPAGISVNMMPFEKVFNEIRGDRVVVESKKIKLIVPKIVEDRALVSIKVSIDSLMNHKHYVKNIYVLNTNHSNSRFITVSLTPSNGKAIFATRVKLDYTSTIVAIAEFNDGRLIQASVFVKVLPPKNCCC